MTEEEHFAKEQTIKKIIAKQEKLCLEFTGCLADKLKMKRKINENKQWLRMFVLKKHSLIED